VSDLDQLRSITLVKTGEHRFEAVSGSGARLPVGEGEDVFSPVELLLTAIAACSALDLDYITGRRAPMTDFRARSEGHKVRDTDGNHLTDLKVTFDIGFPEGPDGDAARAVLPDALRKSHDRLCTVARTVMLGTPVEHVLGSAD